MEVYIGTKMVLAKPMNRLAYNEYRGWDLPDDENGDDAGFLVEYINGSKSNHKNHIGYISWSPDDVFKSTYKTSGQMSFSHVIDLLKDGNKVTRKGWNGNGMWLQIIDPYSNDEYVLHESSTMTIGTLTEYIGMNTVDNCFVPWVASQSDLLANDWEVVK